jgi:hypothetical protein
MMEATTQHTIPSAPQSPDEAQPQFEQCDQCGSPLDHAQRYCVVCGNHRRHVRDPATRYLAAKSARSRAAAEPRRGTRKRSASIGAALVIALIPLTIGLGVLIGKASNNSNNDARLLAALKAQRSQVVASTPTAGTAVDASTRATPVTLRSTFPFQSGYAVELQTLPSSGITQAKITSAEAAAKGKGAKGVGLIVQTQYNVTPKPPAGSYVIYAGAVKTKSAATQELAKLHGKFPAAKVVQVKSTAISVNVNSINANSTNATVSAKVLAKTSYGVVHQVTNFKVNKKQLAAGGAVVKKVQRTLGKSYVNAQRGLPDVIPVP